MLKSNIRFELSAPNVVHRKTITIGPQSKDGKVAKSSSYISCKHDNDRLSVPSSN